MNGSGNWETGAKRIAMTVLSVAVALYIAVQLIRAVAGVLIVIGAAIAVVYLAIQINHYRKSRW